MDGSVNLLQSGSRKLDPEGEASARAHLGHTSLAGASLSSLRQCLCLGLKNLHFFFLSFRKQVTPTQAAHHSPPDAPRNKPYPQEMSVTLLQIPQEINHTHTSCPSLSLRSPRSAPCTMSPCKRFSNWTQSQIFVLGNKHGKMFLELTFPLKSGSFCNRGLRVYGYSLKSMI